MIDFTRLGWDPDLDVIRMGVRDYDPRLSQFLTPDPLFFEDLEKCQASPLQCSLYGYAGGNPLSFVDPSGLGFWSFVRNLAADTVDAGATVAGGFLGGLGGAALGAPTGPGAVLTTAAGAVGGAGLARGFVSPLSDLLRGETPSIQRQLTAVAHGMTAEMGGQVLGQIVRTTIATLKAQSAGKHASAGSNATRAAGGSLEAEVDAAFASGRVRSGTMVQFSDSGGALSGSGPKQGTGAIWYHDNIKIPGAGPGGATVELRTHAPNPRALSGSFSQSNYTTQINTSNGRYLLPDGSWRTIPNMTEAERAAAHYPAGN